MTHLSGNEIKLTFDGSPKGNYSLITEPACSVCSYPLGRDGKCHRADVHSVLKKIYSIGLYQTYGKTEADLLSKHIRNLKKYKGKAEPLGLAITELVKKRDTELLRLVDCLVPVPQEDTELHEDQPTRTKFNQASELANILSSQLGFKIDESLIKTRPQSMQKLGAKERGEKVKDLYHCESGKMKGKRVLIIDDVSTSGSTLAACAEELIRAGATEVRAYVCGINLLS